MNHTLSNPRSQELPPTITNCRDLAWAFITAGRAEWRAEIPECFLNVLKLPEDPAERAQEMLWRADDLENMLAHLSPLLVIQNDAVFLGFHTPGLSAAERQDIAAKITRALPGSDYAVPLPYDVDDVIALDQLPACRIEDFEWPVLSDFLTKKYTGPKLSIDEIIRRASWASSGGELWAVAMLSDCGYAQGAAKAALEKMKSEGRWFAAEVLGRLDKFWNSEIVAGPEGPRRRFVNLPHTLWGDWKIGAPDPDKFDKSKIEITVYDESPRQFNDRIDLVSAAERNSCLKRAAEHLRIPRTALATVENDLEKAAVNPPTASADDEDEDAERSTTEAAPDTVDANSQRTRLLEKIRYGLNHQGFLRAVQYGEMYSAYDLVFLINTEEVAIRIKTTELLKKKAHVAARLSELHQAKALKKVSGKKWPDYADMIIMIAEIKPGLSDREEIEDKVRSYLKSEVERSGIVRYNPKQVVTRESGPEEKTRARWPESFHGTDGKLYIKLPALQVWLCTHFLKVEEKALKAGLSALGFRPERLREIDSKRKRWESRFWVHDSWDSEMQWADGTATAI